MIFNFTLLCKKFRAFGMVSISIHDFLIYMQVEVSGGRGKPSTVVDKDEGLEKV